VGTDDKCILSVKKYRFSCSFTSIPVLTITDAFIISAHTLMVNTKKAVVIATRKKDMHSILTGVR
jgi:hypothetical protein